ncbi:type VI secretion system-associated FHA domain protein TagH [Sphingobium subterraneum]|uniref:Putative component of type VI protein secretion system n=1 Tax=Sphingobium subterraneum TaxID=627688 RepID=A0A841IZY0_9SPHN|nr:type VI secretion system-associated FHA domain protein TagH [Sphingobium subterraneum]MBB6124233.1 putative component of type VI protein secretion system [Sphingobium subterraneum]
MYVFKLFEQASPETMIDARLLQHGNLTVGRDPSADWVMNDPTCAISRWHCEFEAGETGLAVRCLGTNGVFDAKSGDRLPSDEQIPVGVPDAFLFGPYRMVVERAAQATASGTDSGKTLIMSPPLGSTVTVPTEWSDGSAIAAHGSSGGPLMDAFCAGAGLDPSLLAAGDPEDVMRCAGAIYRQMVLGVSDLISERERVRGQYDLTRTTIGGANNNPFKWAPTQRLAIDLLLSGNTGFLGGPDALNQSFRDIKTHLIATFSGFQESLKAVLDTFDPDAIERGCETARSLFKARASSRWEELCARHKALSRQIQEGEDGALNSVFVAAYEATSAQLEAPKA